MRTLRHLLAGYFFILSVPIVIIGFAFGKAARGGHLHLWMSVATEVAIFGTAAIFGKAWWVLWHEELSAARWCISASVMSSICSVVALTLLVRGHRAADFWVAVCVFGVPLAIGICGILFGLTAPAASHPATGNVRLWLVGASSVFLLYCGFGFVMALIRFALALAKHGHFLVTQFLIFVFLGYVEWYLFRSLRRELQDKPAETKNVA